MRTQILTMFILQYTKHTPPPLLPPSTTHAQPVLLSTVSVFDACAHYTLSCSSTKPYIDPNVYSLSLSPQPLPSFPPPPSFIATMYIHDLNIYVLLSNFLLALPNFKNKNFKLITHKLKFPLFIQSISS